MIVAELLVVILGLVITLVCFLIVAIIVKAIAEYNRNDTNFCDVDNPCKGCHCHKRFGG